MKERENRGTTPLAVATLLLVGVMFLLPPWSVPEYDILQHTTSLLGAQGAPGAFLMNGVFLLLGVAVILSALSAFPGMPLLRGLLLLFGASLFLTGIFQHRPLDPGLDYRIRADALHSLFATLTGFAFSLGVVEKGRWRRWGALLMGTASTVLSLLMAGTPELRGLFQRLLFLLAFPWLLLVVKRWRGGRRSAIPPLGKDEKTDDITEQL